MMIIGLVIHLCPMLQHTSGWVWLARAQLVVQVSVVVITHGFACFIIFRSDGQNPGAVVPTAISKEKI